jgi:type II secretion system protein N
MKRRETLASRLAEKPVLRILGFTIFFAFAFVVFAYQTFPYHKLRDFIVDRVQFDHVGSRAQATGNHLSIVQLEPSWFTGVVATGIQFRKEARDALDPPLDLSIPEAHARVSLLPLLIGTAKISFGAELPMGELDGSVATSLLGRPKSMELNFERVNLRALGGLRFLTQIPVKGILDGTIDLDFGGSLEETHGHFSLELTNTEIGDGETKLRIPGLPGGVAVPPVNAGTVVLDLPVEGGVGYIRKLEGRGEHFRVDGAGNFRLKTPFDASLFDILLKAQFADAYAKSNPRAETIVGLLDKTPVASMARTTDGAYQIRVRGSVKTSLRAVPAARDRIEDLKAPPAAE